VFPVKLRDVDFNKTPIGGSGALFVGRDSRIQKSSIQNLAKTGDTSMLMRISGGDVASIDSILSSP
jgi:hypothetical protein